MPRTTSAGRFVLVGVLVAFALGWSLGYPELAVVAVAGALALLLALAWVPRAPTLTVVRHLHPTRIGVGQSAEVELVIENHGRRSSGLLETVDHVGDLPVPIEVPRLRPNATVAVRHQVSPERRGVYDTGPLTTGRSDPFGLLRSERTVGDAEALVVLPRTYPVRPVPAGRTRDLDGAAIDQAEGSITFQSLREYVPGDDLRQIHWRSTARTGTLLVRQHVDPSQPRALVVLDTDPGRYDDDSFELAVSAAASVIAASIATRFPVRLTTGTGDVLLEQGAQGLRLGSYDRLAAVATQPASDVVDAIGTNRSRGAARALVVVTGVSSPELRRAVAVAGRSFEQAILVEVEVGVEPAAELIDKHVRVIRAGDGPGFAATWNRSLG